MWDSCQRRLVLGSAKWTLLQRQNYSPRQDCAPRTNHLLQAITTCYDGRDYTARGYTTILPILWPLPIPRQHITTSYHILSKLDIRAYEIAAPSYVNLRSSDQSEKLANTACDKRKLGELMKSTALPGALYSVVRQLQMSQFRITS